MLIRVLAVGTKMPQWVQTGVSEYGKRLPKDHSLEWQEIAQSRRTKESAAQRMLDEAQAIERHLKPSDTIITLDVEGQSVSTENIAGALVDWRMEGAKPVFLIGGPDGLAPSLKAKAASRWSLGRITLPHPLVRVILSEQLYRAWSINVGHPYHRA